MSSARLASAFLIVIASSASAQESVWIETEHLRGVRGACFPDFDQKTAGHWAMSGPGIAPEWTMGGESEWLSIACGPDDDKAAAITDIEIAEAGEWRLWVRYRDWRNDTEVFTVTIEQAGQPVRTLTFGEKAVIDEEDELKVLFKWAFGWDVRTAALVKGPAKVTLLSSVKQPKHRQVDCICLTTDKAYRPRHREKPQHATWKLLDELRAKPDLAHGAKPLSPLAANFSAPEAWKVRTFRDKGFLYLWNVGKPWQDELASKAANRILVPFHTDLPLVDEFRKVYGNKSDVPIFGDPRVVPAWHSSGPHILDDDNFVKWLEANPDRPWGNLTNYAEVKPMTAKARANWPKFKGRYVGAIAGEAIGVPSWDAAALTAKFKAAKTREEILAALTEVYMAGKAKSEQAIFGEAQPKPYEKTISCHSCEMTAFAHIAREWGATTVGFENTAVFPSLAMRMAFLRGSARQYGGSFATYRSANFGDAATIFAKAGYHYPAIPQNLLDNQYDIWAGAGSTWYKLDIWHQYMSGSAMFYNEQGHDEFWQPGGMSTGLKPLQLSPKGVFIDQFLRLTKEHPDRGVPYTPIAFLLDRAHGWDPNGYLTGAFGHEPNENVAAFTMGRHARSLKEWFKVAYHPYGPKEAEPNTGTNQVYIPGQFGNIYDVLVTSPTRRDAVDAYPVVVLGGDVTISAEWGAKLAAYMNNGGTVIVSDDQLSGPGVAALQLPALGGVAEDAKFEWLPTKKTVTSQRFKYKPITGGMPLATSSKGDAIAASFARGKGKLVMISVPRGLGMDESATPLVPLVLAHARQGLVPVEVAGDVEVLLNRTATGWIVTLINAAGVNKPQHGVVPTDYSQERVVKIRSAKKIASASEWFRKETLTPGGDGGIELIVPAGGVRIVEWKE
jgi:hypothetical protein